MIQLPHELAEWEAQSVARLRAEWTVPELHILAETTSTNDDVRALGERGAETGTTVIAEHQTAGRGRRGRRWYGAAAESLHFSMLMRGPTGGFQCLTTAPVRVGLVVLRALASQAGVHPRLKWPNDLEVRGKKLGGILCETVSGPDTFLVVGIGINVSQKREDFPAELRPFATSVAIEAQRFVNRAALAGAIARELQGAAARIAEPFEQGELESLNEVDALLGYPIEIDGVPAGTAAGIDQEGALRVQTRDGFKTVRSGTVRTTGAIP